MIIPAPERPNQKWSMDFVSDSTVTGRRFRALTIVDDYSRECPAIEVDTSLGGVRVVGVLERLAETRGLPEVITVDNGPEFAGQGPGRMGISEGRQTKLHTSRQAGGECLCRELQRTAA